ncbi:MAG: c-type cytochrome [Chloroflexi bacterium]|nr:c-type cytochrome [Chloroflexota bacterium]
MDDFRKILYAVVIGFIVVIVGWVSFVTFSGCGLSLNNCNAATIKVERTSIPTLIPATLPAQVRFLGATATVISTATTPTTEATASASGETETENTVARPSNPGGPGPAIGLTGDPVSGAQIFATNCQICHNTQGTGGIPNPGSTDGSIPSLNPIDPTIANADYKTFATNIDLFVEHGSRPEGVNPTFSMPAWGDLKKLTPQQIADVISYIISLNPVSTTAASATEAPTPIGGVDIARPSNPGGPGDAINLTGNPTSGAQIFSQNCVSCHNTEGTGGVPNPGSDDGTIPPLNPIDQTMVSSDYKTFAFNIDLFVQHGSTPSGPSPTFSMPAWGDSGKLTQQQIADVIAYIISLNPVSPSATEAPSSASGTTTPAASAPTTAPAATATPTAAAPASSGVPRPSNPGGPGDAVNLTGDANSGAQIFAQNCVPCHNTAGKGGNPNPGSDAGTIPALNPINPALKSSDHLTFVTNLDLFIQHGSTPAGPGPTFSMPAWGDKNALTQQQIADVIAYIISLNP